MAHLRTNSYTLNLMRAAPSKCVFDFLFDLTINQNFIVLECTSKRVKHKPCMLFNQHYLSQVDRNIDTLAIVINSVNVNGLGKKCVFKIAYLLNKISLYQECDKSKSIFVFVLSTTII